MITGKTYEFDVEGNIHVFMRDERWGLTYSGQRVPAGTRFTVVESYWMPPGSDCVPEVKIATDVDIRPGYKERVAERILSVGRALLDLGQIHEVLDDA